jgi:hypothetical protein
MKKLLLSLAIVVIAILSASAQKTESSSSNVKVDVGVTGDIPLGDLGDASSFGFGGFVKGSYPATDNIDGSLEFAYISFPGKSIDGISLASLHLYNFLLGGSYKMEDNNFHIDAGIGFSGGSGSGFLYRIGAGYWVTDAVDVTANYNGATRTGGSLSYIGIGVSYRILK